MKRFKYIVLILLLFKPLEIYAQWSTDPANNLIVGYGQLPELCSDSAASVKVCDILGREMETLVNEEQQKCTYQFQFTPQNLSIGNYLVRMTAGHFTQTTKLAYAK